MGAVNRTLTRGQSYLEKAAPNDPARTARAAKYSRVTDRQTTWRTDWQTYRQTPRSLLTTVCISCIWCSLTIQQRSENVDSIHTNTSSARRSQFLLLLTPTLVASGLVNACPIHTRILVLTLVDVWQKQPTSHSVTLSFVKSEVLNYSFKPNDLISIRK